MWFLVHCRFLADESINLFDNKRFPITLVPRFRNDEGNTDQTGFLITLLITLGNDGGYSNRLLL